MAAPKGNQYTRKYTEEIAIDLFEQALEYAKTNKNCLCIQDARLYIKLPNVSFYDLLKQFKVLKSIKKEIDDVIISRINNGALNNNYNTTASIWRMKQLGEKAFDVRMFGVASFSLAKIASGQIDAYFLHHCHPWDIAGGNIIIQEAGGKITTFGGDKFTGEKKSFIISNGKCSSCNLCMPVSTTLAET